MQAPSLKKIQIIDWAIPLGILLVSALLALSPLLQTHPELAIGITYDLTLTAPLVYFFLIRKKAVPNISVLSFFTIGLVLATLLLPEEQQFHLGLVKTYFLPLVELAVFATIAHQVYRARKAFRAHHSSDRDTYDLLKMSTLEVIGSKKVARIFATEMAMFYYGLFAWKKPKPASNEFTSYQNSGVLALMGVIIFILLIETTALHILLIRWNGIITWILTLTSVYTALQLFAHSKALRQRHSQIEDGKLKLRYGLFGDTEIPLHEIEKIEATWQNVEAGDLKVEKLALLRELEAHNLAIYFKNPQKLERVYGFTKECDVLLLHIDQKEAFREALNDKI